MSKTLSAKDEYYLRQFVRQVPRRLAELDAKLASVESLLSFTRQPLIVIPDADIDPATYVDPYTTPAVGDATLLEYKPLSTTPRFAAAAAARGKVKLLNLHRGMWLWSSVPIVAVIGPGGHAIAQNLGSQPVIYGKAVGTIAAGSQGTVRAYRNNADDRLVNDVQHDHMDGGEDLTDGTELLAQWFNEDNVWRVINAEC